MIILVETTTTKYHKRVNDFCNQIAYGHIQPIDGNPDGHKPAKRIAIAKHIKEDIMPVFKRPNQDVSQKVKNDIREITQKAWTTWRETWSIPESEAIRISFPDAVTDAWKKGQHYYIFTGSFSDDKVIRF